MVSMHLEIPSETVGGSQRLGPASCIQGCHHLSQVWPEGLQPPQPTPPWLWARSRLLPHPWVPRKAPFFPVTVCSVRLSLMKTNFFSYITWALSFSFNVSPPVGSAGSAECLPCGRGVGWWCFRCLEGRDRIWGGKEGWAVARVGVGVESRDEHRNPKPEHCPWGPAASGSDFPAGKVSVFLLGLLASSRPAPGRCGDSEPGAGARR